MKHLDVVIPAFNPGNQLRETVSDLLRQRLPSGWSLGVRVVDDGSTTPVAEQLCADPGSRLRITRSATRQGRATARNTGAASSEADYLHFLDADCSPGSDQFYFQLLSALTGPTDVAFGPIRGRQGGAWGRYLDAVERRRAAAAAKGDLLNAMTAANLLVRRSLFERVGGFAGAYRHYGFEDRDLVARLLDTNPVVAFVEQAWVTHDADNTVAAYCRKLGDAARHSAPLLYARMPKAYLGTAYARLDPQLAGPVKRGLLKMLRSLDAGRTEQLAERLLQSRHAPFRMQLLAIKAAAALSYIEGCRQRDADPRNG